eukprot:m.588582 g.588582  ORF g.588582 m.588582 type:complete len:341 (-) comp58000_c0_seq21:835-1857(-)
MGGCASKPRQEKAGPAGKTGAAPAKPPTTNSKPRQEKTVPAAQRTGAAAAKPTTSNSKLHQEKAGAAAASTREVGTKAGEAAADSKFRVVVVGGGVGGGYAVQALAAVGLAAHTLLVSAEQVLPYERPALSKGFLSKESPARLPGFHTCVGSGGERMAPDWYAAQGVAVRLDTRVEEIDTSQRRLHLSSGEVIEFEYLLLATGVQARRLDFPPAVSEHVHYIRDHADATRFVAALEAAGASASDETPTAVVIGGGYVGLEATAALVSRGLQVSAGNDFPLGHHPQDDFPSFSGFFLFFGQGSRHPQLGPRDGGVPAAQTGRVLPASLRGQGRQVPPQHIS